MYHLTLLLLACWLYIDLFILFWFVPKEGLEGNEF